MKSVSPPSVPSLQARHLSDDFPQGLQGAPVRGKWPGFLHTLFSQCMLPTGRSCPSRRRNCGQTMGSAISKSASHLGANGHTGPSFAIVLVLFCTFSNSPLQGCLLWCLLPHLPGGLGGGRSFFPGPSFPLRLRDSTFLLCWFLHHEAQRKGQPVSLSAKSSVTWRM